MIDTVAWVHLENGRILCARPTGKDTFYIPGGKREGVETDHQTLLREIAEELTVALLPETVRHVATYEADQVRMSCYTADFAGTLAASSEIDELAWFCYADRSRVPPVDQLLFDDLQASARLRLRVGSVPAPLAAHLIRVPLRLLLISSGTSASSTANTSSTSARASGTSTSSDTRCAHTFHKAEIFVEDSALMVDLGPYGCPKSPRKPDPPRKWDRTGSRGGWDSADRATPTPGYHRSAAIWS